MAVDPYLGEIRMWAGTFAPAGWEFCNGQPLPISENSSLFNLIGTTYGGDGQETFNLPDLRSRIPLHQGNSFILAETGGAEEVTLTVNQLPAHSHQFFATTALGDEVTPANNVPAQGSGTQLYRQIPPDVQMAANAIAPVGGSQPHDNMHPYLVISFIISLFGTFPSPT